MSSGAIKHTKRPDLDNCVKFVKDCLNGIVWWDDSQVYEVHAKKIYDENPRTYIIIREII